METRTSIGRKTLEEEKRRKVKTKRDHLIYVMYDPCKSITDIVDNDNNSGNKKNCDKTLIMNSRKESITLS